MVTGAAPAAPSPRPSPSPSRKPCLSDRHTPMVFAPWVSSFWRTQHMASIYKPTGRNKYRIEYKDSTGRTVTVPGFKDKRATEQLARDLERRAEREAAGLPVAAQEMRQAPIADLIQAYADDLARTGRTPKHIDHRTSTVAKIFRELRWPNLTAIRVEPFAQYLRNLNRAPGTQRHYQNSLHGFLQFCCTRG